MSAPSPPASLSRTAQARAVVPELIRDPSALDHLATTLRTWSPFDTSPAPASPQVPPPAPNKGARSARPTQAGVGAVHAVAAPPDALMRGHLEDDDESLEDPSEVSGEPLPDLGEHVAWASWDALPGEGEGDATRRILILGYSSGGLAIWDCSNLDCWSEVLNLPTLDCAFDSKLQKQFRHGVERVVGAVVLPSPSLPPDPLATDRPVLAILARSASSPSSRRSSAVLLYSLRAHRIISTIPVSGVAHRLLANRRFLVVSTTAPLALHVYLPTPAASTYTPAPFSPLQDLLPSPSPPASAAPIFDLGAGGRLLTYASSSPVLSAALSRAPARPGAGILAHRGQFDAELPLAGSFVPDGAGFTVQDAEHVARRVGEGVRTGVAALRERGGQWLRGAPGEAATDERRANSQSVPQQLGAANLAAAAGAGAGAGAAETSPAAGTIKVVDLVASCSMPASASWAKVRGPPAPETKVVAHFRPYGTPLALVSLSPAGTMLLAASAAGHSFDVFELKPAVPVGISATSAAALTSGLDGGGTVWHRYRLHRGFTSASAASASWSVDGRFVAVTTGTGTAHVFALQPGGGAPQLASHFGPRVRNADELAPLSVALGSIARVRSPPSATPGAPRATRPPAVVAFLPQRDSAASALRPTPVPVPAAGRNSHSYTAAVAAAAAAAAAVGAPPLPPFQDALILRPAAAAATLHRLSVSRAPSPLAATTELARAGDVARLASTAASALTQLMKSRGGPLLGAGGAGTTQDDGAAREWAVKCVAMAEWVVGRDGGAKEVREEVRGQVAEVARTGCRGTRYSAFAEIETCSRSPLVLPRSIYQSQQFAFYALPADHTRYTAKGMSALPLRRLEMRSEVQIRQGNGSASSDTSLSSAGQQSSAPFEPASFDQPIKTAMHALLDFDQVAPGSPQLPAPTFPNGVPGKHGSWRDAIPIPRNVGPAAIEGLGRVRQGLGRVRVPAGMLPVSVGRRRSIASPSTAAAAGGRAAAYSSSISFDDDDAVFADPLDGLASASMSASTACTSELGDGCKDAARGSTCGEDADDEDWGWDDRLDDEGPDAGAGAPTSGSSGALAPLSETAPFDEDFVEFELELASVSPGIAHRAAAAAALAVPSPLTLEPVDAASQPAKPSAPATTATAERHLAPPVSVYAAGFDGNSQSPSTSPGSTSGFDAPTAATSIAATHLLDRPGSALSAIGILAPTLNKLAAPTNGGLSSGGSTSASVSGGGAVRKKKRR
ncbi:hypothetical protein JCM3770_006521 [Rhodotorula araucariae]